MKSARLLIAALCISLAFCSLATGADAAEQPNVVLILVDDLGFSDIGCYGSEINTPNLDRLAAGGLRFSQFYNTAKCEHTRASMLSGQFAQDVGIRSLNNCWTLGEAMRAAGYFTIMSGKWHLTSTPTERGFDRYFGHLSGACDFFAGDNTFRLNGEKFTVPEEDFYTTDADTDYALQFIDESRKSGKPFFCYIAYNAPHYPLQAPKEEVEKYLGKYMIGWDELRKRRYAKQLELGIFKKPWRLSPRPSDVRPWESFSDEEQKLEDLRMATFAAMIDRVDQNIGRLVAHLEELGVADDTLIMFLSDNGGCPFDRNRNIDKQPWEAHSHWTYDQHWAHASNTPFRWYKQNQHEGGIATPMIAHWPAGLEAEEGSVTHRVSHLVDIMPTLLDLAGAEYPAEFKGRDLKPLRGESFLPTLEGDQQTRQAPLISDFGKKNRSVRIGQWKLVAVNHGQWELYDMENDRTELNNLADEQPKRVEEMAAVWQRWADEVGIGKKKSKKNYGK